MARSSWILVALVGLVMVGSGMAMLEACPEGQVYADCKNPCGETPEANPCALEEVNNYCKVSWCKPEGEEPGVCSYTCTAPPPPMLIRTMAFNPVSDGSEMAITYVEGEQPLPVDMPVEYLYDEEGNKIRPIAYNYRGGAGGEVATEGPVETYPVLEDHSSLEGVDPIIYQTTGPKEDNPVYTGNPLPVSQPLEDKPTKVYKGGDKPSPRGTKKTKGTKCNQPLARCLVDPCTYTKCGPTTECVRNYCGGCNASCAPKKGSKGPSRTGPSECQAGSYLAKVGKTNTCKKCQAGTYMEEVNSYSKCTPCEAGTYAPRGGAARCLSCPYGTSSKAGARRCRRDAPQKVSGPKGAPARGQKQ